MPNIRPDCAEQSATNFLIEHRRKSNSLAARLTRDVLLLRRAGSSRRAIASALNLSQRRVQTILDGAALARIKQQLFVTRERDADNASVDAALQAGSTMRAEHLKYATRCPRLTHIRISGEGLRMAGRPARTWFRATRVGHFWYKQRLAGGWHDVRPYVAARHDDGDSLGFPGLPGADGDEVDRSPAVGSRCKMTARLRLRSEIRYSPANATPKTEDSHDVFSGGSPLEGGLLFISEPGTALQIRKGALCVRYRGGVERTFPRGRHRVRSIILESPGANVTIEAMRFAIDEGITIFVMHRAGEALAVLTDAPTVDTCAHALELRRAQFGASPRQRLDVARAVLAMKIEACELAERETQDAQRTSPAHVTMRNC